jgi:hypothetical protein
MAISLARKKDIPPPALKVCDSVDEHSADTDESQNALEETATEASGAETNKAPPAALLAPGLHIDDAVEAKQALKLQSSTATREDRRVAGGASDRPLGKTYDS